MDDECPSFKGGLLLPPPSKALEASRMPFFFKKRLKLVPRQGYREGKGRQREGKSKASLKKRFSMKVQI